jgi:hypothetical protein
MAYTRHDTTRHTATMGEQALFSATRVRGGVGGTRDRLEPDHEGKDPSVLCSHTSRHVSKRTKSATEREREVVVVRTFGEAGQAVGGGEEAPALAHRLLAVGGHVSAQARGVVCQALLLEGV